MGIDLYAKIEPYLDFEEEIHSLHKEYLRFIMENDLDNIIDIGCGQGHFLQNLKINHKKAFGIDLSAEQITACKYKSLEAKQISLKDVELLNELKNTQYDICVKKETSFDLVSEFSFEIIDEVKQVFAKGNFVVKLQD
jgi:2-polyprenyl-3-methyl-5-hydroxy-6-metoxy-1,4-benzoquinol methylase